MSKQGTRRRSTAFIAFSWVCSALSVGLLYLSGRAVVSDFSSFRSCSANNSGLYLTSCGKQSLNLGDFILLGLFALAAALVLSLFTASWRITRRTSS